MNLRKLLELIAFLPAIPEDLVLISEEGDQISIKDFLESDWKAGFRRKDQSVEVPGSIADLQEQLVEESREAEEEGTSVSSFSADDLLGLDGRISAMGVLVINRTLTEMILALQNYSVSAEADEFINQLNKESENE